MLYLNHPIPAITGPIPAIDQEETSIAALIDQIKDRNFLLEHRERLDLNDAVEIGGMLAILKSKCPHGTWLPTLEKTRIEPRRAQELINLKYAAPRICHCKSIREAIKIIGEVDAEPIAHVGHATGEHEWYTPPEYIEAAKKVLGAIDLDPASSDIAQEIVGAKAFYTVKDDGLSQHWTGHVWLNPPYSEKLVGKFTSKLCQHYRDKDVDSAILLVNNATETTWFQEAAGFASAMCLPSGRIKFINEDKEPVGSPLQGQAIVYFGKNIRAFVSKFKSFGFCCEVS